MWNRFVAKVSKFGAKIHFPYTRKKVTQERIYSAISVLKPGDLILTHTSGEASNIALDHWSHAGIYVPGIVYEATTHGVVNSNLIYFLAKKDDFKILRPTFEFDYIDLASFLNSAVGKPYDFEFEQNDQQYYCFELAAVAYMQSSEIIIDPTKTIAGYQYLHKSFSLENFKEIHI